MGEMPEAAVEAIAEALPCTIWPHEPGHPYSWLCRVEQRGCMNQAQLAYNAAAPHIRAQIAREILEHTNVPEGVDSKEWRQGFTIGAIQAARIAEGIGK